MLIINSGFGMSVTIIVENDHTITITLQNIAKYGISLLDFLHTLGLADKVVLLLDFRLPSSIMNINEILN